MVHDNGPTAERKRINEQTDKPSRRCRMGNVDGTAYTWARMSTKEPTNNNQRGVKWPGPRENT